MATINDVAREAGVSISTVSYALSGKRAISPDTRRRVEAVAERMGYVPHASARMLATNRSHLIALSAPLHPDTDHSSHMIFAFEATLAARTHDFDTLLLVHDDALDGMKRSAATSLADGILVLDVNAEDERVPLARELSCPSVFIGIPEDNAGLYCVDLDFEEAARIAVDRMHAAGRKNVALISHRPEVIERGSNFPLRFLNGYLNRMEELEMRPFVVHPDTQHPDTYLEQLLRDFPDIDGLILNASREVALAATPVLQNSGRDVPNDVSVVAAGVTYDSSHFPVPFDTIPLDARKNCSVAVELLVQIVDEPKTPPGITLVPPEYIVRGSVVPLSAKKMPATS